MGKALYRKYRSRSLDDIVGQDHVTSILRNAIAKGKVAHAYLFTGPRGVGKTSIARIIAHEINKLPYNEESSHLDIIEIDAASNNGVDDIRDLREKVTLAPLQAEKKIYIIDEVHMLSKPAFNALLKTLEEPPEHVVFILATTDVDKLPETIVSRTQKYTFKQASSSDIVKNLTRIAKAEKIAIDPTALELIASHSGGSYRDSVSLFDQLSTIAPDNTPISVAMIEQALGLASEEAIRALLQHMLAREFMSTVAALKNITARGVQSVTIADQLIREIMNNTDTHQSLLSILDKLIDVRQSSFPDALLLAACGGFCVSDQTTSTIQSSKPLVVDKKPRVIEEIPSLSKKATEAHPKDDLVEKKEMSIKLEKTETITVSRISETTVDWQQILTHIGELSIGLRSVLAKCSMADDGDTVAIYARTEFYKKKIETPKYQQELSQFFTKQTGREWEVVIYPSTAPLKNATAASVAAIMGGGEEVSIEL
jgi:DNA polymerase III subunit gamma/tau